MSCKFHVGDLVLLPEWWGIASDPEDLDIQHYGIIIDLDDVSNKETPRVLADAWKKFGDIIINDNDLTICVLVDGTVHFFNENELRLHEAC